MTPEGRKRALLALAVLVLVSFALLVHASIVNGAPRSLGAVLSLLPLAIFAFLAVRRSRHPRILAAVLALSIPAIWLAWPQVQQYFPDIFFFEHAAGNVVLCYLFGSTLLAGREPLVTRFARMVHGELPAEVVLYSRRVTLAWALFFAGLFATSCLLYLGGFLTAWSIFASILTPILVVAMFVVEYVVRHRVLPNWERVGILGGVQAFVRHQAAPYQPSR